MHVFGTKVIDRSPEDLWGLLMDPVILKRCIAGCESIERTGDGLYRITSKIRFGLLTGRFRGSLEIRDAEPPASYTLQINARGPTGGFTSTSSIRLAPLDGGGRTTVTYEGTASAAGRLTALAGRFFFERAARTFSEEFFAKLRSV